LAAIPNLQMIGEDSRFDDFANQSAVHRVTIPLHVDQTAGTHAHAHPFGAVESALG
jgi:hypothetical protein